MVCWVQEIWRVQAPPNHDDVSSTTLPLLSRYLYLSGELQRRLDEDPSLNNISVLDVDPGAMPTTLTRRGSWLFSVLLSKLMLPLLATLMSLFMRNPSIRTTDKSANDVLAAALTLTRPSGEAPKGLYMDALGQDGDECRGEECDQAGDCVERDGRVGGPRGEGENTGRLELMA